MEETKWLTKTKLIILFILIVVVGTIFAIIILYKNNLKKQYIKFENQLEYASPNYLLKEKITLEKGEWREINITEILKQKLVSNSRASDCEGYVIVQNVNGSSDTKSKAYIKCKKIYTTLNYGTKPTSGKENNEKTQTEQDTENPVLELFGDETITLKVGDKYEELGAVATDNIDGDITKYIKIKSDIDNTKVGTYTVTYTVKDQAGNEAKITRKVIYEEKKEEPKKEEEKQTTPQTPSTPTTPTTPSTPSTTRDTTSPIITFYNQGVYNVSCGNKVDYSSSSSYYGYTARDNVDGDITSRVRVSGDIGNINNNGTYNLYYEVSDSSGNKATASRQFKVENCNTVVPTTPSTISVSSVSITPNSLNLSVGSTNKLSVSVYPSNATDKTITYTSSNTSVVTVDSNGNVRAVSKGSATIRATSSNGKVGTCSITVQ